ncbi:hypothetical protein SO802_018393 [Lithocarpus litseifolius]|uniref:WSC domain-containing protein n=1 Tax=Lithocarpus litseifolius TaxID=425828 RepID=A0AAW2CQG3_9ROSI
MDFCTFSVSASGNRCWLENYFKDGIMDYRCISSETVVEDNKLHGYIENEECVSACGVDRLTIGISSDFIFMSDFTAKLCSTDCYNACFNIVDLYGTNLALTEGIHLSDVCEPMTSEPEKSVPSEPKTSESNSEPKKSEPKTSETKKSEPNTSEPNKSGPPHAMTPSHQSNPAPSPLQS